MSPMTHFYNCHGGPINTNFYGQFKKQAPEAMKSEYIPDKITRGTIVAAECCFGAELFDHKRYELDTVSIANNYLGHGAIAFMGSSTIAYGPSDSQSLADLITQYFVKPILQGASTGRALLEARQKFLIESGPDLDPYELKTLAQFYLLGDPSVQPAQREEAELKAQTVGNAIMNNRKKLFEKGMTLKESIGKTTRTIKGDKGLRHTGAVNRILSDTGFTNNDKASVYKVLSKKRMGSIMQKKMGGNDVKFRTFVQNWHTKSEASRYKVLVIKENPSEILGWRTYYSR